VAQLSEEWSRSPENLARLARLRNSPEGREHAREMARQFHAIPRMGSLREPVYACTDCGDSPDRPLAFRTRDEENAHFAGHPHGRGKRAEVGVIVAGSMRPLARTARA